MFIRKTGHGGYYSNDGTQHSGMGDYLVLFAWNGYKALDEVKGACVECVGMKTARAFNVGRATQQGMHLYMTPESHREFFNAAFNAYESCERHRVAGIAGPRYENGREHLYACVRKAALHQLGHWMMGTVNIGGHRMTVSGDVGSDGLPCDLQKLPARLRERLVLVPMEVAEAYWSDNTGWNDVGTSRSVIVKWACGLLKGATGARV